jgi:cation diffusion facilitator CzcD-associated flavoprotein CzcO
LHSSYATALGSKRPSLEDSYFEVYNRQNVELVNLRETPIAEVTETGIKMQDGKEYELDVLVLATGFDAITGGMTQIDIRDTKGVSIRDRWSQGVYSYLGVAISGFPNLFYLQGAQSPVAATNAPTTNEIQGDWIADTIDYVEKNKLKRIEANREAEIEYKNHINRMASFTLLPSADRLMRFLQLSVIICLQFLTHCQLSHGGKYPRQAS